MTLPGFEDVETNCSAALQVKARQIAGWLKTQRAPIVGDRIIVIFKLKSKVQLRSCISWLRCQGDPKLSRIASSSNGYWWTDDREELKAGLEHLRTRARRDMLAYNSAVSKSFGRNAAQGELL